MMGTKGIEAFLGEVRRRAEESGRFARVSVSGDGVECEASDSAEPAQYRVGPEGGAWWVSLVTKNRWLSESIEADLMHTGDKIEDLIEEELVDQGIEAGRPGCEHFRSDDMYFTFRSRIGDEMPAPETAARWLIAYEACFRNLGDMESGEDEG